MERQAKHRVCLFVVGLSLLLIAATVAIHRIYGPYNFAQVMAIITLFMVVALVAFTVSISYSGTGWRTIEGSTGEWIAAGLIDPIAAAVLYYSTRSEETVRPNQEIAEDDHERMSRL